MQRKIVPDDARMESESGKKTKVENGKSETGWGKAYVLKEHNKSYYSYIVMKL